MSDSIDYCEVCETQVACHLNRGCLKKEARCECVNWARVERVALVRLLSIAQPLMEAWAKAGELEEWHARCEDLVGTAYPRCLCPVCGVEMSVNWRDGAPYDYCPDHGEPEPGTLAAGGGTDAESRILPRSLPPVASPSKLSECPGPTHYAGCACHEKGWQNKWECAVEMAARAEMERDMLRCEVVTLRVAAQEVIDRWDTPLWKDVPATAKFINRLRAALFSENVRADSTIPANGQPEIKAELERG